MALERGALGASQDRAAPASTVANVTSNPAVIPVPPGLPLLLAALVSMGIVRLSGARHQRG